MNKNKKMNWEDVDGKCLHQATSIALLSNRLQHKEPSPQLFFKEYPLYITFFFFFFLSSCKHLKSISSLIGMSINSINGAVSSVDVIIPNDQTLIIPRRTITCRHQGKQVKQG